MVSVVTTLDQQERLYAGLHERDRARVAAALEQATAIYGEQQLATTGQGALPFALDIAGTLAELSTDCESRIAGLLCELQPFDPAAYAMLEETQGKDIFEMVAGVRQLLRLRDITAGQQEQRRGKNAAQLAVAQVETLRKMLLAMASDMRVVLIWLSARLATLRYFAEQKRQDDVTHSYAKETLDLYAPLANRLGIWQLKWELEDLAFRFLEPDTYKRIAKMLEEKRMQRESFVGGAIARLQGEIAEAGIKADVKGRPKHIYSIWNKMRGKELDFTELYDVRAFRVIVDDVKTCYAVLGIVHNIWTPIPREFDDYISRPKANGYQSLHTVVLADDGRALEVQIRTNEMDHFAEYGVAAHWRYKEEGGSNFAAQKYDEKIAWLRQLLAWKSDVADAVVEQEDIR
ncbi:MAG TPA: HD domain-containing protein, partial [Burkholderiaceae bacterium]